MTTLTPARKQQLETPLLAKESPGKRAGSPGTPTTLKERQERNRIRKIAEQCGSLPGGAGVDAISSRVYDAMQYVKPVWEGCKSFAKCATPYAIIAYEKGSAFYAALPIEVCKMIFGVALCFFGG